MVAVHYFVFKMLKYENENQDRIRFTFLYVKIKISTTNIETTFVPHINVFYSIYT